MVNKLGRLDPKTGEFREYPLVEGKNSVSHGLLADHGGNLWFTANFGGYIGKLDPRTGKITQYPMPSEKADDPHTAVFDANGMLWFTLQGGNMVGRLDPKTGKIELKEVPTESALPDGIQINSKDVPIFCELGTNKMASMNPDHGHHGIHIARRRAPAAAGDCSGWSISRISRAATSAR